MMCSTALTSSTYHAYGSMRLTRLSSVFETKFDFRRLRLRFDLFASSKWLFHPFALLILPFLVTLKRFFAPLFVFNFGIIIPRALILMVS